MKNLILILALAISTAAFSQMPSNAFQNDKPLVEPDVDVIYNVTHVSYSVKNEDTDLYGEFESGIVKELISPEVVFNKNMSCFLFPTINSGMIPVLVGELLDEEVQVSGMTLLKFAAKYKFNEVVLECELFVRDRDENRSTLYFVTEHIAIVYELERVGSKPNQRTY
tara:strand:- start:38 stop:538 length:501 start_codon:yes stop_codon:yes gene_type:complete